MERKDNESVKKCIYTVLTDDYDFLNLAPKFPNWETILFIDKQLDDYKGWKPVIINSGKKESRKYKILSHRFLSDYDLVCYIDANMILKAEPPHYPLWYYHNKRRNIFQEANRIIELKKDNPNTVTNQINGYIKNGFQSKTPLFLNGFFVRRHSEKINNLHEQWYAEIEKHSYRDQISLPYACWKTKTFPEGICNFSERYYKLMPHKKSEKELTVHHITAGRADKNIGKAINDLVRNIEDEDWVCLRDIDTLPPYHEVFFYAVEEIAKQGEYDLVSCVTNRLGLVDQLHERKISNDFDMQKHREIAKQLYKENGISVKKTLRGVGGLMMLFSKKIWDKVGGFPEGAISIQGKFFDWHFCQSVYKQKGKIGIAQGIYLFHCYRMDFEDTREGINHLL